MKVLCVLNPLAASGMAIERWPSVRDLLKGFGAEYELLAREGAEVGEQLIQCLNEHGTDCYAAIAGIGGDGTHSALINALMRYQQSHPGNPLPAYAFVPLGTGNDIAKSFALNSREDFLVNDLRRAVSTIIHGADYWLDLGILNGRYFADALTVGLDPVILHERNRQVERMRGIRWLRPFSRSKLLYTISTGLRFWKQRRIDAQVHVDGALWYSGPIINLVINNTRIYAGVFDFCTDAYANDGLLDIVLFTGHNDYLRKYLLAMRPNPEVVRGFSERLNKLASHKQGCSIRIKLGAVEAAQLDGEEIAASDSFEVSVLPKAIHIKTPAEPV